jgi:cephalosporin-C deacetylase-like acetyl esterase
MTDYRARRMREQRWQIDKAIESAGVDFSWGMSAITLSVGGRNIGPDIMAIRARVKKYADISREFFRMGAKREAMAKKAAVEGHSVTARDNYFAAAIFYGMAKWPIHEDDNPELISFNNKMRECYDKFLLNPPHPIERVEIPFEGQSLPGLLHLPLNRKGKVPCVLSFDGMDSFKEAMHPVYDDKIFERGMAILALDGPGQGECLVRKIRCTANNFPRAGKAAVDYLLTRPEIDGDRIGVTGTSMGSFWVTQIAAYEHRLKAAAVMLVCQEPGMNTIFNLACPTFKDRYMWMAGYENENEFDKFANTLTLKGLGDQIRCPYLTVGGEFDQLSPIKYSYDFYNEVKAPRKILVYEGETHSNSQSMDAQTEVADWLKDRLDGKPMQSESIIMDTMGKGTKKT